MGVMRVLRVKTVRTVQKVRGVRWTWGVLRDKTTKGRKTEEGKGEGKRKGVRVYRQRKQRGE